MKVVICQGEPGGDVVTRDNLIDCWKSELRTFEGVDEVVFKERFEIETVGEIVEDADAVIGAWIRDDFFNDDFFKKYPNLKYVATYAHGFGRVDRDAAKKHGVTFTNTIYGDVTIAQFTMALLLEICHNVRLQENYYVSSLRKNQSIGIGSMLKAQSRQIELYEKTMGIIGLGNIGLWVAKMAAGFGMKVIAYNRSRKEGPEYDFVEQVSLDELLERSDVISVHCPLTDATRNLINSTTIEQMKDGVIILNTARGAIINEEDLAEALKSGKIYAAGLDVLSNEPLSACNELMELENTVITPHIAWTPEEARYRTVRIAAENFRNWMRGEPTSLIV